MSMRSKTGVALPEPGSGDQLMSLPWAYTAAQPSEWARKGVRVVSEAYTAI